MTMEYAVLDPDGKCVNRIVWDGKTPWQAPEGCSAVPDPDRNYPLPQQVQIDEPSQAVDAADVSWQ